MQTPRKWPRNRAKLDGRGRREDLITLRKILPPGAPQRPKRAGSAMKQPLGVILAGGQATRMGGGDKGLLPLGDGTILSHVIDRLEPQVASLALNANGDPARFAHLGLPVIPDSINGFAGPLSGVLAGLDWAATQGADHIVTAAADTPFFPCDLVPQLIMAAESAGSQIALARTPDGRHPTFGLWPVALRIAPFRFWLSKDLCTALKS